MPKLTFPLTFPSPLHQFNSNYAKKYLHILPKADGIKDSSDERRKMSSCRPQASAINSDAAHFC